MPAKKRWYPPKPKTGPTPIRHDHLPEMVYLKDELGVAHDCACAGCGQAWELTDHGWKLVA